VAVPRPLLPERVTDDACGLARRWALDTSLARGLVALNRWQKERFAASGFRGPDLWIVSGYRTPERNSQLPGAAENSLHTSCPAMAVDLRLGQSDGRLTPLEVWAILGGRWRLTTGGRWGGNFSDPAKGIPPMIGQNAREQNHFDLGA